MQVPMVVPINVTSMWHFPFTVLSLSPSSIARGGREVITTSVTTSCVSNHYHSLLEPFRNVKEVPFGEYLHVAIAADGPEFE